MQKTYRKLLFDLDNTLVDDDENRRYAIKQILTERKENATTKRIESFIKMDNQFWKDRAEGKIKDPYIFKSNEEKTKWIRAQRFLKFFNDISFEESVEINQKYINYLSKNIIPIKNAYDILKYLYEKRYEIYIVTNGPKIAVNNKLSKINAQKYISGTFTAEEAGHMKPHHEFFAKFFSSINSYKTEDMLIIGDELEEPRSDDIKYISKYKVMEAYKLVNKPCISLDCGFWIDELDGFPRAFVNFALDTIGIEGILKLMESKENRNCRFTKCLSYYDGNELHQFMGKHEGKLSEKMLGNDTDKKWSDLWYIFKPYGYDKTLAQMTDDERKYRKKYESIDSMAEFAKWYKEQQI